MLPFLSRNKSQIAGTIIQKRKADGTGLTTMDPEESNENEGLESCAQDLLSAIEAKDAKGVASAIRAAYEILDSESADESEPTETQGE